MNLKSILRACGASALVAAATLGAISAPVAAQERRDGTDRSEARQQAREARQTMRAQRQQAAPQQRQQAAPQQRQQRTYQAPPVQAQARAQAPTRSGREWNRGDNRSATGAERQGREWNQRGNTSNDWGQARAARAQAEAQQAQAQARAQAAARQTSSRDWSRDRDRSSGTNTWERNRSYGDTSRNRTYRDGYRDGRTIDNRQDRRQTQNAYRSGYRDGVRTDNYRDCQRRYSGDYRRWSNDWRRDNRYNWYQYRSSNRNLYRLGRYYAPYSNYRYSRLSIGFRLGSVFFGSRYWINDPWQYRLPEAYGPYRWVRYYDDALLVDIYSGEVVDVIYDFFW